MDNKQVAVLLFALTLVVAFVAWSYDEALSKIVNTQCSHGSSCPMYATIDAQRGLAIGLIAILLLVSIGIFIWAPATMIIREIIRPKPRQPVKLEGDEKTVFEMVCRNKGQMFQGDILAQTGFSKVKVSRVLDRLEQMELVERKRRGMANLIVVRNDANPG